MPIRSSIATTVGAAVGLVVAGSVYVAVAAPMASSGTAKTAASPACAAPNLLQDGVCVALVAGEVAAVEAVAAPLPAPADLEVDAPVAGPGASVPIAVAAAPAAAEWTAPLAAAKVVPVRTTTVALPLQTARVVAPAAVAVTVPIVAALPAAPLSSEARNAADVARSLADEARDRAEDRARDVENGENRD